MLAFLHAGRRDASDAAATGRSETRPLLLGSSEAITKLRTLIAKIAKRRSPPAVLVVGPTGSGKELIARALHHESGRARGPFVSVNCAAIAPTLFESEFFGHERGAFTGATERRPGFLESAAGGVLFLDEIGDMPLEHQPKLLRTLEMGTYCSVGSTKERTADAWVIAATNVDLREKVRAGAFREDLYYRLNIVPLRSPSLAERRDDIALLAQAFGAELETPRTFSSDALRWLEGRSWNGNVRELRAFLHRLDIVCAATHITLRDFLGSVAALPDAMDEDLTSLEGPGLRKTSASFDELTSAFQARLIQGALDACGGNHSAAARKLGITRNRLALMRKTAK